MNCDETRRLLDAHLDGELERDREAEVLAHLRACEHCRTFAPSHARWIAELRENLPRFAPPAGLATAIRTRFAQESDATRGGAVASTRAHRRGVTSWWWPSLAAAALALVIGFQWGRQTRGADLAGSELITKHVLALTSGRAVDVISTDRHTVKPWLAEHAGFSPPVADLRASGFPLEGARLEQIGGRAVAALVYHRFKHVVTLYTWPAEDGGQPAGLEQRGFHLRTWSTGGFAFAAVSDVAPGELMRFESLLRTQEPVSGEEQ